MERRVCTKCKIEKEINEFPKDKTKPWFNGYDCYCKVCKRENVKKQYLKNREYKINKVKKWVKDNPEKFKENIKRNREKRKKLGIDKKYYLDNKEKIQKHSKEYHERNKKEGYYRKNGSWIKTKPKMSLEERKIANSFRDRIKKALKLDRKSAFELLGCSIQELRKHLESQFLPEMNWNNWGKIWEIDHIKGCYNFNLKDKEQQKICFHYTNLRPLFSTTTIAESFGYKDYIGNRNRPRSH